VAFALDNQKLRRPVPVKARPALSLGGWPVHLGLKDRKKPRKGQTGMKKPATLGVTGFSLAQWEGFEVEKGRPRGCHPMPNNAAKYCNY